MGHDMEQLLKVLLIGAAGLTAFILLLIFVVIPIFRGVGVGIGYGFRAIGWFFMHIADFIGGMLGDIVRFIGALLAMVVLVPLVPLNIVIGRWSAAGHFGEGVKRECQVAAACVYRAVLRRPLKLVFLGGLLEGLEQRVPEAMHGAPGGDAPGRRAGQFDGYTILGSLRAGGSGAKLYVAEPLPDKARKFRGMPQRVVIKSFTLTEGSSLPQIVRESRALECAKQLGHVLDHGMDEHRFFYVMPYHPGDHLGILTRQMHGECGGRGLDQQRLNQAMSYVGDLLATLSAYHRGGLWHKDVKPENVIVHDGHAHLVDLGLVTPLRSAMTLTTHGTEYFRDPEMVRQALRGVKVHQVDGAKFDVYAAGAVLYFMVENTFPAHGGLSRFVTPSPEAIRWIIRRAMTEYNQRYATAEEMLVDLASVARARDAYAVKPADLPSMRGEAVPAAANVAAQFAAAAGAAGSAVETVFAAGTTVPVGHGAGLPFEGKPRIKVTNWWTGEHRVEGAGDGSPSGDAFEASARDFRKQAQAFRQQARAMAAQARVGAVSARQAAREQIKAARQRAREVRARAAAHRCRVNGRKKSCNSSAAVIGTLSIAFLAIILTFSLRSHHSSARSASVAAPPQPGLRVIIVPDPLLPASAELSKYIQSEKRSQAGKGRKVVVDDQAVKDLAPLVNAWVEQPSPTTDKALEDLLQANGVYAVVNVTGRKTSGGRQTFRSNEIHSTRPDADSRRGERVAALPAAMTPPVSSLPYLLINDHPAKVDPKVSARVDQLTQSWRQAGWKIATNDDVEVKARLLLPPGAIGTQTRLPAALSQVLKDGGLGGILRIETRQGDGPPEDRITVSRIDAQSLAAAEPETSQAQAPAAVIEIKDADLVTSPAAATASSIAAPAVPAPAAPPAPPATEPSGVAIGGR